MNIKLTEEQINTISDALQFSIDNGLADDYENIEALFKTLNIS
jgi:hypothetical protein